MIVKNPYGIPLIEGMAIFISDYSQDHDLIWTVWDYDSGAIWQVRNPYIRMSECRTIGRIYTKESIEYGKKQKKGYK